jgi:hypothetical protein
MTEQHASEPKKIEGDCEERRELDRRCRDCEMRLLELQCLLKQMGVVTGDQPETDVSDRGADRGGGQPANA